MKTPRFELKDFRLNEILSMLTTYSGPIQEKESGKEIARLRGHFDGENFRRPSGEPMYAFCRGFHATKYKSLIKCWPDAQKSEWISGDFLARVAEFDRRLVEEMEGYEKCLSR